MDLRQLIITPDLLKLIVEVDEFKAVWRVTQLLSLERLQLQRYMATIKNIGSSARIDGCEVERLRGRGAASRA
jgi:hypothetical protein